MEVYIEDKKNLYAAILNFLEESDEPNENEIFTNQKIEEGEDEMRQFLEMVKSIGEHHHRDQLFNGRVNQLLKHYKDQIKQTLSNPDIYHIFENNKKIVLFLIKNGIITITDEIYYEIISKIENNGNQYCHFFIPELENFVGEEQIKFVKSELLKENPNFFTNYEEKRQKGENDSYVCSLIREDLVKEFIAYLNSHNISPYSEISPSIFETNPFLIDNVKTTLIEYSAFFGSIQIFRYLVMSKVELTPSLWLYAIHSKNPELIHLLESNEVPPPEFKSKRKEEEEEEEEKKEVDNTNKKYLYCLIESIKCHHNDIVDYIEINFLDQKKKDPQQKEEIISNCIKYHNYKYFENDSIIDHSFFNLCLYHYDKLVELLLKKKEKLIKKPINIQKASEKNEVEFVYYYLLQFGEISSGLFRYSRIKQISIPSSITSIKSKAFFKCSSLTQITIPSSVTSIGEDAFNGCSSLTQITIPPFVTSIEDYAFYECSSLTQIAIPSSVTSIGNEVFRGCSSLTQITILSSLISIGEYAFYDCISLTQITIPSYVISIGEYAFSRCSSLDKLKIIPREKKLIEYYNNQFILYKSNPNSEIYDTLVRTKSTINSVIIPSFITKIADGSFKRCPLLTQVTIPSSVTSIGNSVFSECSSLTQIVIPSSVTSIGNSTFSGCSSLTQITIPSSVTSIGEDAFFECSSLVRITIPLSVTSIEKALFYNCSSLTQVTIPSSVTSIGSSAFSGCSSLTQIAIPSSVTSIGNYAFYGCSSLTQIAIPSSVTSIGNEVFRGCSSLTQIVIPSSVTSIGQGAFEGCSSLTQIAIPSSVTSIGDNAFYGCSSLKKVTIPPSINKKFLFFFYGLKSDTNVEYDLSQ